jgi:hypothetical protein
MKFNDIGFGLKTLRDRDGNSNGAAAGRHVTLGYCGFLQVCLNLST